MRVVILGGTGPSGILLTREFLRRYPDGHAVLYARSPSKFPGDITSNPNVLVVQGELADENTLELVFAHGHVDAVLSTLGPALFAGNTIDLPGAYATLLKLMKAHGCKRFIGLSTVSVPDPQDKFSLSRWTLVALVKLFAHEAYRNIVDSAAFILEKSTEEFGVEYVLVRVPVLTTKGGQKVIAGYVGDGRTGPVLSRYAAAEFFVDQIEGIEWVNKQPAISSANK